MSKQLKVYLNTKKVGVLSQSQQGGLAFDYSKDWLKDASHYPISLALPLNQVVDPAQATAFFAGVLPEGLVRENLCRKFGISSQNDFALLSQIGRECAGAISLWPDKEEPQFKGEYEILKKEKLIGMFSAKSSASVLLGSPYYRLSLAGAQDKAALFFKKGQWFEPKGFYPSSHILKPQIPGLLDSALNEFFCMTLAQRVGLNTATTFLVDFGVPVLCVERFDRKPEKMGLTRLHQEDFCQALGILSSRKYESEGGPTLQACFTLIEQNSRDPLLDKALLLKWVIFNFLIGNADAHAKNISWFVDGQGFLLTPFYDLLCTAVYAGLTDRLSMKIGGENRPGRIFKRHWERFAHEVNLTPKFVFLQIEELTQKIIPAIQLVKNEVKAQSSQTNIVSDIESVIKKRIKQSEL